VNLRANVENSIDKLNKKEEEIDIIFEEFEEIQTKIHDFMTAENETTLLAKASELEEQLWNVKNSMSNCRETIKNFNQENNDDDESVHSEKSDNDKH
jgi:chaperonin cofactor prefoldin